MEMQLLASASGEALLAVFIAGGVILAMAFAMARWRAVQSRRRKLFEFASRSGFSFVPEPSDHHEQYTSFAYFDRGDRRTRRSANLIHGRRGEIEWEFFDFSNEIILRRNEPKVVWGVVLANVAAVFPRLRIRPRTPIDELSSTFGLNPIEFESEEFGRRYTISSADRKFAYDLIHPKMMEYLMAAPVVDWQLGGRTILIVNSRRYRADELSDAMKLVEGFISLIPQYVRQDRGAA